MNSLPKDLIPQGKIEILQHSQDGYVFAQRRDDECEIWSVEPCEGETPDSGLFLGVDTLPEGLGVESLIYIPPPEQGKPVIVGSWQFVTKCQCGKKICECRFAVGIPQTITEALLGVRHGGVLPPLYSGISPEMGGEQLLDVISDLCFKIQDTTPSTPESAPSLNDLFRYYRADPELPNNYWPNSGKKPTREQMFRVAIIHLDAAVFDAWGEILRSTDPTMRVGKSQAEEALRSIRARNAFDPGSVSRGDFELACGLATTLRAINEVLRWRI